MAYYYYITKGCVGNGDAVGINCKQGATTENQGFWRTWCVATRWWISKEAMTRIYIVADHKQV